MPRKVFPTLPSKIGARGKLVVRPNGYVRHYTITDEIRLAQTDFPQKIICLQRIEFDDDRRKELRLGYYIVGTKPKMLGRRIWDQFAALMPLRDFRALVRQGGNEGWM